MQGDAEAASLQLGTMSGTKTGELGAATVMCKGCALAARNSVERTSTVSKVNSGVAPTRQWKGRWIFGILWIALGTSTDQKNITMFAAVDATTCFCTSANIIFCLVTFRRLRLQLRFRRVQGQFRPDPHDGSAITLGIITTTNTSRPNLGRIRAQIPGHILGQIRDTFHVRKVKLPCLVPDAPQSTLPQQKHVKKLNATRPNAIECVTHDLRCG